jgi:N6-L-threonylcarbamoyladenine synthase
MMKHVLAVETSCDDTSVAIVKTDGTVLAMLSADQNQAHEAYGGIVPEIASRNHTHHLIPLIDAVLNKSSITMDDIDGFAVTASPGLIGSLLVGLVSVKTLSLATGKPFIGVNHLEGHIFAPFLRDESYSPAFDLNSGPFVALAISGGHTTVYLVKGLGSYEVLGQTIDDAAGEAFDKFGKMLGLGFPGGARVDRLAELGVATRFEFPEPLLKDDHLNFSFSGMKSAGLRILSSLSETEKTELREQAEKALRGHFSSGLLADLCAGFQKAMVNVLMTRLRQACAKTACKHIVLTGGVSANSALRKQAEQVAEDNAYRLLIPPLKYCTDNAAMIGYVGAMRMQRGESSEQNLAPAARAPLGVAPLPKNLPDWLLRAKS